MQAREGSAPQRVRRTASNAAFCHGRLARKPACRKSVISWLMIDAKSPPVVDVARVACIACKSVARRADVSDRVLEERHNEGFGTFRGCSPGLRIGQLGEVWTYVEDAAQIIRRDGAIDQGERELERFASDRIGR
jgi:hypothetical protein